MPLKAKKGKSKLRVLKQATPHLGRTQANRGSLARASKAASLPLSPVGAMLPIVASMACCQAWASVKTNHQDMDRRFKGMKRGMNHPRRMNHQELDGRFFVYSIYQGCILGLTIF